MNLEHITHRSIRLLEKVRSQPGLLLLDTGPLIWLEQLDRITYDDPHKKVDIADDAMRAERAVEFLDYLVLLARRSKNSHTPLHKRLYITEEVAVEYERAIDSFRERANNSWNLAEKRRANRKGKIVSYMPIEKARILDRLAVAVDTIASRRQEFLDAVPRAERIVPCWDAYDVFRQYLQTRPKPSKSNNKEGLEEHAAHDDSILSKAMALQLRMPVNLLTTDGDLHIRYRQLYDDPQQSPALSPRQCSYGLKLFTLYKDRKGLRRNPLHPRFYCHITTEDMPVLYG